IMNNNDEIGVLGGQSKAEYETTPSRWFNDWKNSFAIGQQNSTDGDVTWTRGFVWGAAMVVRKEAWKKLHSKEFKSLLTDRKGKTLSAGGDTEICYALRNEGWKIWYDSRLKFYHFISKERLDWSYLRKLFRGFGQASKALDSYTKNSSEKIIPAKKLSISKSARVELHKTLSFLRQPVYKKLILSKKDFEGNNNIPMIDYSIGRIEGLLKTRDTYNRGVKLFKRAATKNDYKLLSSAFKNYDRKFPAYKNLSKLNGVSVIICTYNGEERLTETIRHIAKQKVNPRILWELILVDNASTDNTKRVVLEEWKSHSPKAKLKIVDEFTQGLSAARQKGFETSQYEYIVLCDDDNLLDENFVQVTYDVMSSNDSIGILGGPNEALCELAPPEWFKWFQHGYAAGTQADLISGKISEGNVTWKRGFVWGAGMIIRKTALIELYAGGFKSLMSDRKGNQLSSGGDSELCFALVLCGWQVWYDTRLKLKHCMPAGRLSWNYLIRLFESFGITSVGLDYYEKAIKLGRMDVDEKKVNSLNWWHEIKKSCNELRKIGIKRILSLRFPHDNITSVPMMEYHIARLKELIRVRKNYDKNLQDIKNAPWKKSFKELKIEYRKFIETENDFRYGWPWGSESHLTVSQTNGKSLPKISILTPSFNSENTIEKAILSVLNQNYPNFEHIICDGGSADRTVEIIKKYPHIKWISEKDRGQCDAMNKAFDMSTGEVITYLNVDDYFQRGVFNKITKAFEKNPDAEMVVGNLYFECYDHTYIRKPETEYKKIMLPFKYLFPINPVSYFYKRKVQENIGSFPLDNHYAMDYWFLLRAYQKHKLVKIEDYLGTFCMNGLNKTSATDNRKNVHQVAMNHCKKYDRKNLLFYLYNYYKFYYYERKIYNVKSLFDKFKLNFRRIYSILTFKMNKYYSERMYLRSRSNYYLKKRFRSVTNLLSSFLIYPKGFKKRSRQSLFIYSLLGKNKAEKAKVAYCFLTTPPGLPLANKLYYFGNEFKKNNKQAKGNSLLLLTFIISPNFFFKGKKGGKSIAVKSLRNFNLLKLPKDFINFFRYKKFKAISNNNFEKARSKQYYNKNFQASLLILKSFLIYPASIKNRSRWNLLMYASLKNTLREKVNFVYHLYHDNPEYPLAHKLNYYGNELRKDKQILKGNAVLFLTYILSPKYISKRERIKKTNIVYVSDYIDIEKKTSLNPLNWARKFLRFMRKLMNGEINVFSRIRYHYEMALYRLKLIFYYYFKYKKYRVQSKKLHTLAQKNYNNNNNFNAVMLLLLSFIVYPRSVFSSRNKRSLLINSILGKSLAQKVKKEFKVK
ncbi:MAG: glycosyltransferase, partial [bacterium]